MGIRVLAVAATQLQLLIILHMLSQKSSLGEECSFDDVDLVIVDDSTFYHDNMRESLLELGIFHAVYRLEQNKVPTVRAKTTIRDWFWRITKRFDKYYRNGIEQGFIQECYDRILCFDEKMLLRLKKSDKLKDCTVYCFDEGTSSYIGNDLRRRYETGHYKGIFTYNPQLVEPVAEIEIWPILKKMELDSEFLTWANKVFDYNKQNDLHPGDIFYFDQPIEDEHLREWVYTLLENIGKNHKIYVKPHPRSREKNIEHYRALGDNVQLFSEDRVPWELVLLNNPVNNLCFFTISSTAALSHALYLKNSRQNQSVYLYAVYKNMYPNTTAYEVNENIERILQRFSKYIPNMYIPQTEKEVFDMISSEDFGCGRRSLRNECRLSIK